MNMRNYLKSILSLKGLTLTKLAEMLTEKTGRKYTIKSFSHRLGRESITVKELFVIAELLDYEIKFIELPKK